MKNDLNFKSLTGTFEVKSGDKKGTFVAYGNTFNKVDNAGDKTMVGAFTKCIKDWKEKGEFPQFLSQHGHSKNPIGIITDLKEDENGLKFKGEFCLETQDGREAYALVKMGALKRFSIGYLTKKERMKNGVNELHELYVKEISLVTFACNEDSLLQSVKSAVENGDNPMRSIQNFIQDQGLSKRQAESAINAIKEQGKIESMKQLELDKIKQKVKNHKPNVHLEEAQILKTKSEMSMNEYVSMVCCAVTDSLKSKYEKDDEVYMYCEDLYTDFLIMCIYDYREDACCKEYVKVPYSVVDGNNVMVGSPVQVTRLTKWVTEEERNAIESEQKSNPSEDLEGKSDTESEDSGEPNAEEEEDPKVGEEEEAPKEKGADDITADDIKSWFS